MRAPVRLTHRARDATPMVKRVEGERMDRRVSDQRECLPEGSVRPRLVTPAFIGLGLAALAYFFADAVLIPLCRVRQRSAGWRRRLGGDRGRRVQRVRLLVRPWAGDSRTVAVESCPW